MAFPGRSGLPAGLALVAVVGLSPPTTVAVAQVVRSDVVLVPHRAVYDITLVQASLGAGISQMSGRMVYELRGNACSGYSQKMRFVTRITDRSGTAQVNDLRTSSWEGGLAVKMRFHLSQYRNDTLTDSTRGKAVRGKNATSAIDVQLEKPHRKGLEIDPEAYFPMQHSIALIEAAKKGHRQLAVKVYDGSEKGEKVFWTSAYIGNRIADDVPVINPSVSKVFADQSLNAWPVSISFFDGGGEHTDAVPSYELSFRFIENGVSTQLHIDYGDFAVRGKLKALSLLPKAACDGEGGAQ